MDVAARLEALAAENERLRDQVATLKDALGMTFMAPVQLQLTAHEGRILGRLLKGGGATKTALYACLYGARWDCEVEPKIIDVLVCRLRRKLKVHGLAIETVWGQGYRMSGEQIAAYHARFGDPERIAA